MATKKRGVIGTIANSSNREYAIAFVDGETATSCYCFLEGILVDTNDEYKYAIHERLDDVLDLKTGERLQMWFNRDNHEDSIGFIKRIK